MKKTISTFVLAGALVLGGLPALAADPVPQQQPTAKAEKQRLTKAYNTMAWRAAGTKIGAEQQAAEKRAIADLIRRLEEGENVAPSEVDRVLQAR